MNDYFNRPISIGDTVICRYITASSANITIGKVTGFTTKKVKVDCRVNLNQDYFTSQHNNARKELKDPYQCVIINTEFNNAIKSNPELFL